MLLFLRNFSIPLMCAITSFAQSDEDALRFSRTFHMGTARFSSMGGAFTALGGDLSTAAFNPAGLATDPSSLEVGLRESMDDDLNSSLAIASLFDWVRIINQWHEGSNAGSKEDLEQLRTIFHRWVFDILGLSDEKAAGADDHLAPVMNLVLELRKGAKEDKNWALSDKIRDGLAAAGIKVMDKKDGTSEWQLQ